MSVAVQMISTWIGCSIHCKSIKLITLIKNGAAQINAMIRIAIEIVFSRTIL